VQRAAGLRLGLAAIAAAVGSRPAHLLEVGSSAGLVVRQSLYGYQLGGESFGDRNSPIQLITEWRSDRPVPALDNVPLLASIAGIDLNPLNPEDDDDRRWLEALVWPEDRAKAQLMRPRSNSPLRCPSPSSKAMLSTAAPNGYTPSRLGQLGLCSIARPGCMCRSNGARCSTTRSTTLAKTGRYTSSRSTVTDSPSLTRTDEPHIAFDVDGHLDWAQPADR